MTETFKVFGLGQCGTRIAQEFEAFGVEACYINSDDGDVRGVSSKNMLQLDSAGTGCSPKKGREIVEKSIPKFKDFIKKHASDTKINLVVAGAGGGTGGGISFPTLEALKQLGVKVGCLITMPLKAQSILAMDNAFRTLKEIKNLDLDLFVIADNDHLTSTFDISKDWWGTINEQIVNTLLLPYSVLDSDNVSKTGFGSIDKEEVNRIVQYGRGLTDIRSAIFSKKEIHNMDEKEIKAKLFAPNLIEGYEYKYSLAYLISIEVPAKGEYNEFANKILSVAQKVAGSAVARVGTFTNESLKDTVEVIMVNTGLKLPKVLQSRLNNLKRDNDRFVQKKEKTDTVSLDLGETVF